MFKSKLHFAAFVLFVLIGILAAFFYNRFILPTLGATMIRPGDIIGPYFIGAVLMGAIGFLLFSKKN